MCLIYTWNAYSSKSCPQTTQEEEQEARQQLQKKPLRNVHKKPQKKNHLNDAMILRPVLKNWNWWKIQDSENVKGIISKQ